MTARSDGITRVGPHYESQRAYARANRERKLAAKPEWPAMERPAVKQRASERDKQRMREWTERNREHKLAYSRAYYAENRDRYKVQMRARSLRRWLALAGWSQEEYDARLAAGCGICGRNTKLVFDHEHGTNRVRGLLCTRCNVRLEWALEFANALGRYVTAAVETHEL